MASDNVGFRFCREEDDVWTLGVIAFHEKAGRSQVVSLSFLFVTRFFSAELPTVATLPSALFDERVFSLGASWFSGCPRGHRVYTEAGCQGTVRLQAFSILTLEPERLQNRPATTREDQRRWKGLFTRDTQAACGFSFSASKPSPFFHRVRVIAAILRASVSRAIVGFMPFPTRAW